MNRELHDFVHFTGNHGSEAQARQEALVRAVFAEPVSELVKRYTASSPF